MKIATYEKTCDTHSRHNAPQITVSSGEEFEVWTELCSGPWLKTLSDSWSPDKVSAANPTVVVGVEGAMPGDILKIRILSVKPNSIGYTGSSAVFNPLATRIKPGEWGLDTRTVEIKDDFIRWSEKLFIPVKPMIGTLGVAPQGEAIGNTYGGEHGGNMDVQEVCEGASVYFNVNTPQALLHIGDAHAIQGDGEINAAGGIECRSTVRLEAEVLKGKKPISCVRLTNEEYIMTVYCGKSLEDSFYRACAGLMDWMTEEYGFTYKDAYLLLGQVMESRNTQFVNPTYSYICKMPKKYLQ